MLLSVSRLVCMLVVVVLVAGCSFGKDSHWSPPPSEIYAASYLGAVLRSLDGGSNWLPLGSDPRPLRAYCKSIAIGSDNEIFVATSGGGFFALEDSDKPYYARNQGLRPSNIRAILYSEENRTLWVGGWGGGVFASVDGGKSWSSRNDGLTAYHVNCLYRDPSDPTRLYCGTTAGLFVSTDGERWANVAGLTGSDVRALQILPDGGSLYAGLGWGTGENRVLESTDGRTWKPADRGLPNSTIFCLTYDELGDRALAGTEDGVYERKEGGWRWTRLGRELSDLRVFALTTSEGYCYAATDHGLFGVAPGSSCWNSLSGEIGPSAVTDVVVRPTPPPSQ